jgi:phosphotransferase system HPr (HPr) family protein
MCVTTSAVLCSSKLVVPKGSGLHLRPAAMLMKEACRFDADIWVEYEDKRASAKSLMNVIMLCAAQGAEITVVANGYDAPVAIQAIEDLFARLEEEDHLAETEASTPPTGPALVAQLSEQVHQLGRHIRDLPRNAVSKMRTRRAASVEPTGQGEWKEEGMTLKNMPGTPAKRTPAKNNRKVRFELTAPAGSDVFVAGTFNNWDPRENPMRDNPNEGVFTATVSLPRGRHEYRFVVNGVWLSDPKCPEAVANAYGSLNSVIEV